MTLIDNWRKVILHSWTVWLSALSAAIQAVYIAWPTVMIDIWNVVPDSLKALLPYRLAMLIPLILTVGAIGVRPLVQKKISGGDNGATDQ